MIGLTEAYCCLERMTLWREQKECSISKKEEKKLICLDNNSVFYIHPVVEHRKWESRVHDIGLAKKFFRVFP